jgi:hypothetical protein
MGVCKARQAAAAGPGLPWRCGAQAGRAPSHPPPAARCPRGPSFPAARPAASRQRSTPRPDPRRGLRADSRAAVAWAVASPGVAATGMRTTTSREACRTQVGARRAGPRPTRPRPCRHPAPILQRPPPPTQLHLLGLLEAVDGKAGGQRQLQPSHVGDLRRLRFCRGLRGRGSPRRTAWCAAESGCTQRAQAGMGTGAGGGASSAPPARIARTCTMPQTASAPNTRDCCVATSFLGVWMATPPGPRVTPLPLPCGGVGAPALHKGRRQRWCPQGADPGPGVVLPAPAMTPSSAWGRPRT